MLLWICVVFVVLGETLLVVFVIGIFTQQYAPFSNTL